jgi:ribosomal protein L2
VKVVVLFLLLFFMAEAKGLDFRQILTLKTVKNVALQYPNKKGETLEETAMAICLAETSGGKVKWGDKQLLRRGIKQASYGIMQVRLATARFVARKYNLIDVKLMSDTQIITKMMHDPIFNARIAVLYLVYLSDTSKSYFEAISRYNGGRINYPYYNKVQRCLKVIRRHGL